MNISFCMSVLYITVNVQYLMVDYAGSKIKYH